MGDPAGIGPEVVMKALADPSIQGMARPVVIGDAKRLAKAGKLAGVHKKLSGDDCIDLGLVPEDLPFGQTSAIAGEASFRYIERAVKLTVDGTLDAMVTGPISKEAINAAGHKYP